MKIHIIKADDYERIVFDLDGIKVIKELKDINRNELAGMMEKAAKELRG